MDKPREFSDTASKSMVEKPVQSVKISSVKIQSLFPAHIIHNGQVTGKRYEWANAGSIADVDERDVEELLAYHIGTTNCCGSLVGGNQVFQRI